MRIIINATNLAGGGGVQVAFSVIHECKKFIEHDFHVLLRSNLSAEIDTTIFPLNFSFYEIKDMPSFTIKGIKVIKLLKHLEKEIKPDVVFTVFGPSYWTPKAPHLMGYAIPHFLYKDSPFFKIIKSSERLSWVLLSRIKRYFFLKNADYYHVETDDVKNRLAQFLSVSKDVIHTVSNNYNAVYDDFKLMKHEVRLLKNFSGSFKFLSLSAYYNHKNFEILNKVIPLLKEKGFNDVKFVFTLQNDIFETVFTETAKSQMLNLGPLAVADCPQLYYECDAVFLPTLLECFSANYPEAMVMERPILTSDLSFAKEICQDAALYFNPVNAADIAELIIKIISDTDIQKNIVAKGKNRLGDFDTAAERTRKYLDICKIISTDNIH